MGIAASMAALLLAAGTKRKRYALPNSRVMIHQPLGEQKGRLDIEIQAREIINLREITNNLLAKHTGQPLDKISRDVDRNFWMNAEEAKKYGLIDEIFTSVRKAGRRENLGVHSFEREVMGCLNSAMKKGN